jgi:DHA1 family bicyclomycin/chloramphenicol resistance-like MFS transporter
MRMLSYYALVVLTILSILFMIYTFANDGHPPLWTLVTFFMVIFFCIGILFGNFNAMAMEPLGHIAGVAAAVIGSITTFVSLGIGTVIAQLYDGTVFPLVASFAILGALSLGAMAWTVKTSQSAVEPG